MTALIAIALASSAGAQTPRSTITIHVGKSGVFSGFGHDHVVVAPIAHGSVDAKAMVVEITVITTQMKVTDSDASEKDRAEVQKTMLGPKVLDADKFPEIHFKSSRVQQTSPRHFRVTGKLSLHGVTKELEFEVTGGPQRYQGKTRFKQTEFGIEPVNAGGGAVKVKDELELEFDIYPADLGSKR
ncbi:MAG: YceI family protein [Acidobacteriia bacterium]|nr:YceI family protein [Terriglobia bacterium]